MKSKFFVLAGLSLAASFASAVIIDVPITFNNADSVDLYGDADNLWAMFDMDDLYSYSNYNVIGISWDVNLYADSPSWLSDMSLAVENSTQTAGIFLTPGIGDDFGGSANYTSGGMIDLTAYNLDFALNADNKLRVELFETYDDYTNDWDGIWESGNVTLRMEAVPEPASMVALAAGVALLARRRNRK